MTGSISQTPSTLSSINDPQKRVVEIDWQRYHAMLEDETLSEEEKQQFLEALWQIVVQFVDLGFGVHPLQSIHTHSDAASITLEAALSDVVSSVSSAQSMFDNAAREPKSSTGERRKPCKNR